MARSNAVWGIDLGQSALKALRCKPNEDATRITAEAFDIIEYPKVLSAPDADAVELVREALKQFLSRNVVKGDKVAISVPGQAGLARFIKLPPVESKKIPDIVKYEARQQIPFPLDDVIWDYQQMGGGAEEDGFSLETEVGLFAMKRDQVYRALKPFEEAGIEVDIVQLAPLALYNFIAFDQMRDLPKADEYDPDDPPESVVLLSMGCDTSDLVVTNGFRVWQRSVPIGGNHFTKALVKELDLPFAKAEHLKRNATQAEDPKAVFQAMRPVFNDLSTECQRTLNFFQNLDRNAKISKIVGLGGVMKLPGIRTFLEQNLGHDVERLENFDRLSGSTVIESPIFKDNLLSFATCYGLCVQALRTPKIRTNLIPGEVLQERMIRAKKPWAVAAAAALMAGLAINGIGNYWRAWNTVHASRFEAAERTSASIVQLAKGKQAEHAKLEDEFKDLKGKGDHLVVNAEARTEWLELLKAINVCLPPYPPELMQVDLQNTTELARITARHQINITSIDSQFVEDVAQWSAMVQKLPHVQSMAPKPAAPGDQPADPNAAPATPVAAGPTGKGWIVRLTGHHYHNPDNPDDQAVKYVQKTLLRKLKQPKVYFEGSNVPQDVKDLGIYDPEILQNTNIYKFDIENAQEPKPFGGGIGNAPKFNPGGGGFGGGEFGGGMGGGPPMNRPAPPQPPGGMGPGVGGKGKGPAAVVRPPLILKRIDFQIAFVWQPIPKSVREATDLKRAKEAEQKAKEAIAAGVAPPAGMFPGQAPQGAPVGTPPTGTPPTGTPPTGTPPAGSPPAGSPPVVAPPVGAPATNQTKVVPPTSATVAGNEGGR